ncbi:hypothetical protein [Stutzerimonas xanthomarina]|uniref:hypothetical protein n=1 Tax=Stutzerimonas xanthomarina TaxID=271420 RepID=UPI0029A8BDED|nr:hypothetical protein [Stutzerimonas xanthomarina]MDX2350931.1 hypothetical protein [Stutzerimonas xanthomarina]
MNSVPESYLGVWRRRLLTTTDGRRDETSDVYWLQTAQLHADIRIPHPPTASASLATCSQAQQLDLCEQSGFAGLTLVEGDICQWQRLIDYQPPGAAPDIGRMRFEGADQLLEDGLDGRYHEVWQRVPESEGTNWGLWLRSADEPERQACLLVAGDYFMFAADRPVALDADGSRLRDQVARAAPAKRLELLACEISFGRQRNGATPWMISHSTLPGRVGDSLLPSYWNFSQPAGIPEEDLARIGQFPPALGWVSVANPHLPTVKEVVA